LKVPKSIIGWERLQGVGTGSRLARVPMTEILEQADIWAFCLINRSGQNAFLDVFMPFMSDLDNFRIPLVLFWVLLVVKKGVKLRVVGIAILVLIGLSESLCTDVLKPVFNRPRPYHSQSHVHHYDRMAKTWRITPELENTVRNESRSMPSAHATNIFAAAFFLSAFLRKSWPFFYLIAVTVGYSRVYLGVHFPFDVIVGAIVGTMCGLALMYPSRWAIQAIEKRRPAPG